MQKNAAEAEARRLSQPVPIAKAVIVEPAFGQIKQARGFRQFLLRGLEAVQAEWALICTTHNITKLCQGSLRAPISNPHAVQTLSGRAPSSTILVLLRPHSYPRRLLDVRVVRPGIFWSELIVKLMRLVKSRLL